ncbi:MAG: S1 RNA-binding domain-containing protein [Brevinema sp.]
MNTYDDIFLQAMNEPKQDSQQGKTVQKGKVVSQTENGFFIALGGKSEMILPNTEILGSVIIGDEIDIVQMGMRDGIAQVSQKKALIVRSLENLQESVENNTPVTATVTRVLMNKESKNVGYMVSINGVEAFLPFSHVRVPKNEQELIGQSFNVVVIKMERDRIVVSERVLRDQFQKEYFTQFTSMYKIGDRIPVTVSSIADSFALVTAENITMFLHITQLDWKYIKNLNDVLKVGDKFEVVIDQIDSTKKSIKVSRKAAIENPTLVFIKTKKVGDNINAKVVRFARGLVILEDDNGVEMILPVSEMSWVNRDPKQLLNLGDRLEVKIKELDHEKQRISVSLRDLLENPWSNAEVNYALKTIHQGKVTSITEFGIFVVFEDGIQGLIRKEDIDWSNDNLNLAEHFKKGDHVSAVVLNIEAKKEKLRLGIKQLSKNPYQNFADNHPVGSLVSGVVKEIFTDGVEVELENNIMAFIHISQLSVNTVNDIKEVCKEGDTVQAAVRRINHQKIELSIKEVTYAEERAAINQVMSSQTQETPTLGSILGDALKKK